MCLRPWAEVQDRQQREPTQCPTSSRPPPWPSRPPLRAPSPVPPTSPPRRSASPTPRTGGKVKVEVYPAGELGDQPALAEQVTLGALDSAVVSLGNLAMYSKKLNAMTAPFLFKDYDHAHRTIDAFVMPWMNEGLAQHDAVGLSMFDYGFRQTTTKGVPVNSAADLKGVKIRVPPATGLLAAFDAVGANTQKIAYSEPQAGRRDGRGKPRLHDSRRLAL